MQRRTLLRAGGAALALALPVPLLFRRRPPPKGLRADPAGLLDLPPGFSYRVLERRGDPMSDGYRVPGLPDGMACFAGASGTLVLMRNHEVGRYFGMSAYAPGTAAPPEAFDASAHGGVTRLVVDEKTLSRVSSNLVLTGTLRNCAGGPSPWGWLSCEESTDAGHGWVFLCRTNASRVAKPERIAAYGRMNHEAVCIDPKTHVAYLTEDRSDSCLYRFVPKKKDVPFDGRLQALRVRGENGFDVAKRLSPGRRVDVDWVDVPDPNAGDDALRRRARERGAAVIRRGEGIWLHGRTVYACSTSGGKSANGQLLALGLDDAGDTLEVVAEGTGETGLEGPDNITVAPWGDLYVAEDAGGDQYLRGITAKGRVFDLARNAKSSGEMAGVCFSPSGHAMFVNLQREGITLAITGPFTELGRRSA